MREQVFDRAMNIGDYRETFDVTPIDPLLVPIEELDEPEPDEVPAPVAAR